MEQPEAEERPDPRTFRHVYTFVIMFLSFAVLAVGGMVYTNHVQRTADHQWCDLLQSLATPLDMNSNPPPTPRQVKINAQLRDLYRKKCA